MFTCQKLNVVESSYYELRSTMSAENLPQRTAESNFEANVEARLHHLANRFVGEAMANITQQETL